MAEYINREELLKDIEDSVRFSTRNGVSAELRGAHKIVDCIRSAPACDVVEVVHGHWVLLNTNPYGDPNIKNRTQKICSCCGWTNACRYAYCPSCGAKMDGERRSE